VVRDKTVVMEEEVVAMKIATEHKIVDISHHK